MGKGLLLNTDVYKAGVETLLLGAFLSLVGYLIGFAFPVGWLRIEYCNWAYIWKSTYHWRIAPFFASLNQFWKRNYIFKTFEKFKYFFFNKYVSIWLYVFWCLSNIVWDFICWHWVTINFAFFWRWVWEYNLLHIKLL